MANTIYVVEQTISNADLKSGATITLVAAPTSPYFYAVDQVYFKLNYGGNNAFTASNPVAIGNGADSSLIVLGDTFWKATTNAYGYYGGAATLATTETNFLAKSLNFVLSGGTTGNAANDNTVTVIVYYRIIKF